MRATRALVLLTIILAATAVAITALSATGITLPSEIPRLGSLIGTSAPGVDGDDGYIEPGGSVSVFDEHVPAIAHLNPSLREAVQAAARDAQADGYVFVITGGWRSAEYQRMLFDNAVAEYGSIEKARELVATPGTSHHETGDAVDIGYTDADSWMSQHGSDYGLCQTYTNEMWHFELLTTPGGECPEQLPGAQ